MKSQVPAGMEGQAAILMPQAGNTMEEGTLLSWRVKIGDTVQLGQVLGEIETDKATVELESTEAGMIAWLAPTGSVVAVKEPVAFLEGKSGVAPRPVVGEPVKESPAVPQVTLPLTPAPAPPAQPATAPSARVKASPLARRMAADQGIDLQRLTGSGPGGRILSTDLANGGLPPNGGARANVSAPGWFQGSGAVPSAGPMGALSSGRRPLTGMRKAIASNLQTSKQTVPHFYVRCTIHADALMSFYRAQKTATGCTLNDVVLLAVGRVVGEMPSFRTRIQGDELVETGAAHIGLAVSVPDGLVVPVVLNVHAATLAALAAESRRVVEAARQGKIENPGKGVFSVSNMGMLGVEEFSAIINPPESGILAVGAVREAVLVHDGALRPGRVMTVNLSVDHRVVDGAAAAAFVARLRQLLEQPQLLLG